MILNLFSFAGFLFAILGAVSFLYSLYFAIQFDAQAKKAGGVHNLSFETFKAFPKRFLLAQIIAGSSICASIIFFVWSADEESRNIFLLLFCVGGGAFLGLASAGKVLIKVYAKRGH